MIVETLQTPVTKTCDVLVCGGGFGGISAALAAARHGSKVILLEKEYILGGLGTAGLVTMYLPLCDGMGRQVSFGIAEELLKLSISMGAEADYPANWLDSDDPAGRTAETPRYRTQYNPHLFAILAEQLLRREGVEILYGTVVTVDHGDGSSTVYANLAELPAVNVGDWVEPGDVIGAVGATALCESGQGTHLHFAVYSDGGCIDPLTCLPA